MTLEASWGRQPLLDALERGLRFRRFKADDIRDILTAGPLAPNPTAPGRPLQLALPEAPTRSLDEYSLEAIR